MYGNNLDPRGIRTRAPSNRRYILYPFDHGDNPAVVVVVVVVAVTVPVVVECFMSSKSLS